MERLLEKLSYNSRVSTWVIGVGLLSFVNGIATPSIYSYDSSPPKVENIIHPGETRRFILEDKIIIEYTINRADGKYLQIVKVSDIEGHALKEYVTDNPAWILGKSSNDSVTIYDEYMRTCLYRNDTFKGPDGFYYDLEQNGANEEKKSLVEEEFRKSTEELRKIKLNLDTLL